MDRLTREQVERLTGQFALLAARQNWTPQSIDKIRAFGDLALQSLSQEAVRDEALEEQTLDKLWTAAFQAYGAPIGDKPEAVALRRYVERALKREPNAAAQGSPKEHTAEMPTDTAPTSAAHQFRTEDCPTYDASVTPAPATSGAASMVKRLRSVTANSQLCREAAVLIENLARSLR